MSRFSVLYILLHTHFHHILGNSSQLSLRDSCCYLVCYQTCFLLVVFIRVYMCGMYVCMHIHMCVWYVCVRVCGICLLMCVCLYVSLWLMSGSSSVITVFNEVASLKFRTSQCALSSWPVCPRNPLSAFQC